MDWNEIEIGENYLYKGKKVRISNGFREVNLDLNKDKSEKYRLHLIAKGGLAINITSDTKEFEDIEPLKQKLPETGLVVSLNYYERYIVMRTNKRCGYGFNLLGNYEPEGGAWSFETRPDIWRPATKEDEERWKELLKKECIKKGYKKGVKVKCLCNNRVYTIGDGLGENITGQRFWLKTTIFGENVQVMNNGKWAEIIEEDKKESSPKYFVDGREVTENEFLKATGYDVDKERLLEDSITALKNYLNAGDKEQRRASSVIAKKVIERYNVLKK